MLALDFAVFISVDSRSNNGSSQMALNDIDDEAANEDIGNFEPVNIAVKAEEISLENEKVLLDNSFGEEPLVESKLPLNLKLFNSNLYGPSLSKDDESGYGVAGSRRNVIVLSFHDLSPKRISPSIITPVHAFISILKAFKEERYETFFASDINGLMEGRIKVRSGYKPVVITFDDGYKNNHALLLPVLKKYRAKATFFLITSKLKDKRSSESDNALTWSEIEEMASTGLVEIGSHTHNNHKNLVKFLHQKKTIPEKRRRLYGIYKDLCQSRRLLKNRLGINLVSLAWPHGKEDKHLIYAAKKAGFEQVFNTRYGINRYRKKSLFRLKRISASSPWLTAEALLDRMNQVNGRRRYCMVSGQ